MRRTLVGYDFPLSRRFRLGPWARGGVRDALGLHTAPNTPRGRGTLRAQVPAACPPQVSLDLPAKPQGHVHTCARPLTMCLVCPWFVRPDKRGTEHEACGRTPTLSTPGRPGGAGEATRAHPTPTAHPRRGLGQASQLPWVWPSQQPPGSGGVGLRPAARAHTQAVPPTQPAGGPAPVTGPPSTAALTDGRSSAPRSHPGGRTGARPAAPEAQAPHACGVRA